jgi:hypothetical protein
MIAGPLVRDENLLECGLKDTGRFPKYWELPKKIAFEAER